MPNGRTKTPVNTTPTHIKVTTIALLSVTSLNAMIPINTATQIEHSLIGIAKL